MTTEGVEFLIDFAGTVLRVGARECLPDFARFLRNFPAADNEPGATIRLCPGKQNACMAEFRRRELTFVYGQDGAAAALSELDMEIGLLQAVARFVAGLHCLDGGAGANMVLLHGTVVALPSGEGVALLDDGACRGKTTLAVALARCGAALVADEFSFVDTERLVALGGGHWPVHVRADMANILLPDLGIATELHLPPADLGLKSVGFAKLRAILFPRPGTAQSLSALPPARARDSLLSASTDHLRKFCDPSRDRVSVMHGTKPRLDVQEGQLLTGSRFAANRIARAIPCFEAIVADPLATAQSLLNLLEGSNTGAPPTAM